MCAIKKWFWSLICFHIRTTFIFQAECVLIWNICLQIEFLCFHTHLGFLWSSLLTGVVRVSFAGVSISIDYYPLLLFIESCMAYLPSLQVSSVLLGSNFLKEFYLSSRYVSKLFYLSNWFSYITCCLFDCLAYFICQVFISLLFFYGCLWLWVWSLCLPSHGIRK